jgi:uncharacterized membrane protein
MLIERRRQSLKTKARTLCLGNAKLHTKRFKIQFDGRAERWTSIPSIYLPSKRLLTAGSLSSAPSSRHSVSLLLSQTSSGRLVLVRRRTEVQHYDQYKIRIGRSLLLGLEVMVAADIVKSIAISLTVTSLGLLAGLVLVRTFLSWTLALEIDGRWPWQPHLPTSIGQSA